MEITLDLKELISPEIRHAAGIWGYLQYRGTSENG
jgi:hypothetical protein